MICTSIMSLKQNDSTYSGFYQMLYGHIIVWTYGIFLSLKHEVVICNEKVIIFVICLDITNFNVEIFSDVLVQKWWARHNMKPI
jgi:hypothetical protein